MLLSQILATFLTDVFLYRRISGTGNRHPITTDRVPAAAIQARSQDLSVLLTDTTLLGALVVLWHLRRPNLDVLA